MKLEKFLQITMALVLATAVLPALVSISRTSLAFQSPVPTATFTPLPAMPTNTPTNTPPPPTPTNTPPPPTPTNTPAASTPTNTPPPPTPTDTPVPPTPTPIPVPPGMGSINVDPPSALVAVGEDLDFTVVFTIPNTVDLDTATWDWGDGGISDCPPGSAACMVDPGDGIVGTLAGSHAYSEPGIYTVQATVLDRFGQVDTSTFEFVVVYDASGGFATGGGWINSQAGAYKPDPTLAGKATFGFVSKYKKGATVPTGRTEFKFQVADVSFHSDTYHWLVVNQNGTNAQFKGDGTVNGAAGPGGDNYQFMIWAKDDSSDTFRIKIWYMDSETPIVVYDNGVKQPIDGGNIAVHKAKGAK
jgi:hypothetical protein